MSNNNKVNNKSSSVSINKTKNDMKDQVILTTTITTTTTTNNSGDDGSNNDNNAHLLSDIILSLLTTYLQLPEGKLLNSKDKKKILLWLQSYNNNGIIGSSRDDSSNDNCIATSNISSNIWSVEEIKDNYTVTLLNKDNNEIWKEDYIISNIHQYIDQLKQMLLSGGSSSDGDGSKEATVDHRDSSNDEDSDSGTVYIELDEVKNKIIRILVP